jgi:hypothetical protein
MTLDFPRWLSIEPQDLASGHRVGITVVRDMPALAQQMAADIVDIIRAARDAGRHPTLIIPVGPWISSPFWRNW